jgi:hypothetical protein
MAAPLEVPLDFVRGSVLDDGPVAEGLSAILAIDSPEQEGYGVFRLRKQRFQSPAGDDAHVGVDHDFLHTTICAIW